ncbi:uncharacterized protein MONOS_2276 [Monocercomonoides exilis]|uniref:uncharacterized protein n=1 Tax=Monocercomonoides exilis TaxID=2049356 RepID=UPI0035594220|nr:hypothetical protein MONOS_2276 [Monocercomonoides exilis]|eukprot:MONOS_2276.1-p1 / transcript=MONOS_2276.1 / gene=MONOS_2276 / organism=Monocercomonoides_exilis_PA203 / gene_product=unspecified product / transcript_product=unspecified product / location=Mono_scaffold00046:43496-44012(+) / protein_length=126 / sequence_SO=supercontig / SO=protein_coding / is_pseudo=false
MQRNLSYEDDFSMLWSAFGMSRNTHITEDQNMPLFEIKTVDSPIELASKQMKRAQKQLSSQLDFQHLAAGEEIQGQCCHCLKVIKKEQINYCDICGKILCTDCYIKKYGKFNTLIICPDCSLETD